MVTGAAGRGGAGGGAAWPTAGGRRRWWYCHRSLLLNGPLPLQHLSCQRFTLGPGARLGFRTCALGLEPAPLVGRIANRLLAAPGRIMTGLRPARWRRHVGSRRKRSFSRCRGTARPGRASAVDAPHAQYVDLCRTAPVRPLRLRPVEQLHRANDAVLAGRADRRGALARQQSNGPGFDVGRATLVGDHYSGQHDAAVLRLDAHGPQAARGRIDVDAAGPRREVNVLAADRKPRLGVGRDGRNSEKEQHEQEG